MIQQDSVSGDRHGGSSVLSRRVAIAAVILLTGLSGVCHGVLTGRWTDGEDKTIAARRLERLPARVGRWQLVESIELDPAAAATLRCYGNHAASYRHRGTGAIVSAAILYGPRGPIAVHTPEVCYAGGGQDATGDRAVRAIDPVGNGGLSGEDRDEFWSVQFADRGRTTATVHCMYGWSDGGRFAAASHPRFWLSDDLYKIQVAGPVMDTAGDDSFEPCADFLRSWLPHVHTAIATPPPPRP